MLRPEARFAQANVDDRPAVEAAIDEHVMLARVSCAPPSVNARACPVACGRPWRRPRREQQAASDT